MNAQLIEFLVGLYFIGVSIAITKQQNNTYSKSFDIFKFGFGVGLLGLALLQGFRFI